VRQFALLLVLLVPVVAMHSRADTGAVDPARWEKDISQFEAWDRQNSPARESVLFVGSSSIRMWPTRVDFPDLPVINRGFGGAHISDVNAFAERIVLPYAPRIIVFYCGDNDIKAGKSIPRVVGDYRNFVDIVRGALPETRIIYLPIKPSVSRWKWWPSMQEVNEAVREIGKQDHLLYYADVATPMLGPEAGMPPADLFIADGLHLSEKGNALWVEYLRPVLDRALSNP
jgi:lysophospholipase L1-like esterase